MVGDAPLRIVVGANLGGAVAGGHQGLASRRDVVHILLVLLVVDECAQSGEGALLVFRLVAGFGTLDKNLLHLAGVGVLPVVAQAYARLHLIDILASGAGGAEGVPLDFALVDDHVERLCLGQHGHRGGAGVYAALGFGGGHSLHAVDSALILESAINIGSGDGAHNLLVAAHGTLAKRRHLQLPAFGLAVFGVHAEEVAGKECCLVAAGAATYLEDSVLAVLGVLRHKHQLDFLFQRRDLLLAFCHLLARHFLEVGVGLVDEHVLTFLQVAEQGGVFLAGGHEVLQFLVFLGQSDVALLVADYVGVGD